MRSEIVLLPVFIWKCPYANHPIPQHIQPFIHITRYHQVSISAILASISGSNLDKLPHVQNCMPGTDGDRCTPSGRHQTSASRIALASHSGSNQVTLVRQVRASHYLSYLADLIQDCKLVKTLRSSSVTLSEEPFMRTSTGLRCFHYSAVKTI